MSRVKKEKGPDFHPARGWEQNFLREAASRTTVHLSGGFGFVYSPHFCACTPNIGVWQEYKQGVETHGQWFNLPLRFNDGALTVPQRAGVGIVEPKEILKVTELVKG